MTAIKRLDAAEFRRRLAGLSDVAGGQDVNPDEFRELASDYVLLLAICFNRRRLDALTLWGRIDGAIERGLAECDNEDLERFVSVGLEHVLASVNVVACYPPALEIQGRLFGLSEEERVFFLQYVARHRMPSIVFGRQKWERLKADREQALLLAEAESVDAGGEAPADSRGESPPAAAARRRKKAPPKKK